MHQLARDACAVGGRNLSSDRSCFCAHRHRIVGVLELPVCRDAGRIAEQCLVMVESQSHSHVHSHAHSQPLQSPLPLAAPLNFRPLAIAFVLISIQQCLFEEQR